MDKPSGPKIMWFVWRKFAPKTNENVVLKFVARPGRWPLSGNYDRKYIVNAISTVR